MTGPVLRLTDIVKTFPGVMALRSVSFEVLPGEVHALVGENGAGKSTLMAVAAGSLAPDSGLVEIGGLPLENASPSLAQSLGLGVVYQHNSVLEDLSVAENMAFSLPRERRPRKRALLDWCRQRTIAVGADLDPRQRVATLGVAERQLLEIAKALAMQARVLVLDEPTEALASEESERLFAQVRLLTSTGASVVYISHRLPEVKRIADRITVLRDGETRGTFDAAAVSSDDILQLIVGRPVDHVFPDKRGGTANEARSPALTVRLDGGRLHDVAFSVWPGEIVGLAGVEGNGQRDVLRALAGMAPVDGEVQVGGDSVSLTSPRAARDAGIAYIPRDRHSEGVFENLSIRENASLLSLGSFARAGAVSRARESTAVQAVSTALAVKAPHLETEVRNLSGGNQQKVVLARTLLAAPRMVLADEPTRGVDVGARIELYQILRSIADEGRAVVVASADTLELEGLCDRVLVFSRGRVVGELTGSELTERNITGAAITAEGSSQHHPVRDGKGRWSALLSGDYVPSAAVALLIVLFAVYTTSSNSLFLGGRSLNSLLLLASATALVALGQLVVLLVGSIDLSVGPLMGLVVGILSFTTGQGSGSAGAVRGVGLSLAAGVGVGLVNAFLVRAARLPAVIATLVTYTCLTGLALLLRPQPGGSIDSAFTDKLLQSSGAVPLSICVVAVLTVLLEVLLRRSRWGVTLRAVGSDETRAFRLGARVTLTHYGAHVACSLGAVLAGFMLASQVGIGQAPLGSEYTLASITAVVLGGASLLGGRGSFLGATLGALLIQEIISATSFLGLTQAWQQWLPGLLIVLGAGLYSRSQASTKIHAVA